jgi:geranylgeranyl diphosphate synthase type II
LIAGRYNAEARTAAAAIEMVHTYSLVHDDLPAMDDDDLRRGRPTCHKAFDEATAILTGDGLLTLAFEVLADGIGAAALAVRLIGELARAAGPAGMIAGQVADLKAESTVGSVAMLEYIHTNKTAKMFRCAATMGALCAGASGEQLRTLGQYGLKIGLGFQIADDILDVSASSEQLGKTAGKDLKAAKCTYPAVVGIEKARTWRQLAPGSSPAGAVRRPRPPCCGSWPWLYWTETSRSSHPLRFSSTDREKMDVGEKNLRAELSLLSVLIRPMLRQDPARRNMRTEKSGFSMLIYLFARAGLRTPQWATQGPRKTAKEILREPSIGGMEHWGKNHENMDVRHRRLLDVLNMCLPAVAEQTTLVQERRQGIQRPSRIRFPNDGTFLVVSGHRLCGPETSTI